MNSLLKMLGNTNPVMQLFNQIAGLLGRNNPQDALNQMGQSSPQIKQVQDFINQNGGDAQSAFYALARQRGVDPNEVLQKVRGMIGR